MNLPLVGQSRNVVFLVTRCWRYLLVAFDSVAPPGHEPEAAATVS
jgi:hypothetical protein